MMGNELKAALFAFVPWEHNNNTVKIFTIVATAVWGIATLGVLFGGVELETTEAKAAYSALTTFAGYMYGRVHTEERQRLDNLED